MTSNNRSSGTPLIQKALLALAAMAVLLIGAWLVVAQLAPANRWGQIITGAIFFVVVAVAISQLAKRYRPDLRLPLRAGVIVAAVLAAGGLYWTGFRDTVVNEEIAIAAPRDATPVAASDPPAEDAESAPEEAVPPPAEEPAPADDASPAPAPEPPPPPAPEPEPEPEPMNQELSSGQFVGLDNHAGTGDARIIDLAEGGQVVTFTNFDVDPGPQVNVYLSPSDSYDSSDVVLLGGLKGNVGDQQYEIPEGTDLSRYSTVLLWCEPFSTRIAAANLS